MTRFPILLATVVAGASLFGPCAWKGSAVWAADGLQADAPAPKSVAPDPFDPTQAVVAQGHFIYRQRDLDALMAIAQRHARNKLTKADEERLRQVLIQAFTAREPFLDLLGALPPNLNGAARDGLILDLLDYQSQPASLPPNQGPNIPPPLASDIRATGPGAGAGSGAVPTATPAALPTPPAPQLLAPAGADSTVLVRLPVLTLVRTLDGIGKRQISLGLALYFHDSAQAKALENKAPLIQDALLGFVQAMPAALFAEPDQLVLKSGLTKAVQARIPEFPVDGILIPHVESTVPSATALTPTAPQP